MKQKLEILIENFETDKITGSSQATENSSAKQKLQIYLDLLYQLQGPMLYGALDWYLAESLNCKPLLPSRSQWRLIHTRLK